MDAFTEAFIGGIVDFFVQLLLAPVLAGLQLAFGGFFPA